MTERSVYQQERDRREAEQRRQSYGSESYGYRNHQREQEAQKSVFSAYDALTAAGRRS